MLGGLTGGAARPIAGGFRAELHPDHGRADVPGMALLDPTWWERRMARRRAGSRAREKYRQMRKSWLRRKRRLWVGLAAVLAVIWVTWTAGCFLVAPAEQRGMAFWMSGLMAGGCMTLFVIARDMPPASIENWQQGAFGEAETAKVLAKLPPEWAVLHDLRNGDYNFDHVVVGPPGLFLLNSKWSTYRLELADGEARGVHPDDESLTMRLDPMIRQAKRDAVDLKRTIQARTGRALWVQPVIVWWGGGDGARTVDGVAIVPGKVLVERLLQLPEKRRTDLADVVAVLRPGRHRAGRERRRLAVAASA